MTSKPINVIIYTTKVCNACMLTKRLFRRAGIPYEERALAKHGDVAERFIAKGATQAPIVQVMRGNHVEDEWAGFQPAKIKRWCGNG